MQETGKHGGARAGAGRPHEHQWYLEVEVVDFYGDKDVLVVGPLVNRNGTESRRIEREAERVAAHHVGEQAQSVKIMKRLCCASGPAEVVRVVKEGEINLDKATRDHILTAIHVLWERDWEVSLQSVKDMLQKGFHVDAAPQAIEQVLASLLPNAQSAWLAQFDSAKLAERQILYPQEP